MNDEMPQLAAQLTELAENAGAGRMPDVERARREGRGRMRRRRLAALGGAVALMIGVAALGVSFQRPTHGTPEPATSSLSGSDPLITEVQFGWLPDWAVLGVGYASLNGENSASVQGEGEGNQPRLSLSLEKPGAPSMPPGMQWTQRDAPRVKGRPAYWLTPVPVDGITKAPNQELMLRWQTPNGRWAHLYGDLMPAGLEETLLRVAADAKFGAWEVPLPVQLTGVTEPVGTAYLYLQRPEPDKAWSVHMELKVGKEGIVLNAFPVADRPQPSPSAVERQGKGSGSSPDPAPTGQAPLATCRQDEEVRVCLSLGGRLSPEQEARLKTMLNEIRLLGATPENWTTDVFRR
ncbi:hypothetical protein [Kitasatospora sp. P5_F3]